MTESRPHPRTEAEYDAAHKDYDRWLRELERLEGLLANSEHDSPERRDGLRFDVAECRRTVRDYERILEPS